MCFLIAFRFNGAPQIKKNKNLKAIKKALHWSAILSQVRSAEGHSLKGTHTGKLWKTAQIPFDRYSQFLLFSVCVEIKKN